VTLLSRLIDDLLEVSRITQGKIQLVREPVDLKTVAPTPWS
jgi:signal transduction histidine kinase